MTPKTLTLLCGAPVAKGVVTQVRAAESGYTLRASVRATSYDPFRGISQWRLDPAAVAWA
jgi:hypothetical protein